MSLIKNECIDAECLLGIWQITEDYDTLRSYVELFPGEQERLDSFRSHNRKLEWLSVRVLLKHMLNKSVQITYNGNRKPFLSDNSYHISISHSHQLTSILLSKQRKVGIDLEFMNHDITRLKERFINEKEYITTNGHQKHHLYIHWCAKEAIYKICDKKGISFKKNIIINKFEPNRKGVITGMVDNPNWEENFNLNYFEYNNYIVAYSVK